MASRLPVVVAQSAQRDPRAVNFEEQLITDLMFSNGLDATLIRPLAQVALDSTDHLCLEGFRGPFALLTWSPIADAAEHLSRLSIHGRLFDRESGSYLSSEQPANSRRIDHFQLKIGETTAHWLVQLTAILSSFEVKTFAIGSKAIGHVSSKTEPAAPISIMKKSEVASTGDLTNQPNQGLSLDEDEENWSHLDDLLDNFDEAEV
jgi:hypothetical protein